MLLIGTDNYAELGAASGVPYDGYTSGITMTTQPDSLQLLK